MPNDNQTDKATADSPAAHGSEVPTPRTDELRDSLMLLFQLETQEQELEARRKQVWIQAGDAMRTVRKAYGLSLRDTAKRLGVSAPFYSDMELGRRHPSIKWLQKLSTVLNQHNDQAQPQPPGGNGGAQNK